MGYDLHITRAGHWIDAHEKPISQAEWESFARAKLTEAGEITWSDIGTEPVFEFDCTSGDVVSLYWRRDHVIVTGLTSAKSVTSLQWVAEAFGALLVGDDGESY